jgi:hypothetical protein
MVEHTVYVDDQMAQAAGMLFGFTAHTLEDQRAARRASMPARVALCAEIVAQSPNEQWVIWCDLNAESEALTKAIPGAVEVTGSDSDTYKEDAISAFTGVMCQCEFFRKHGAKRKEKKNENTTQKTEPPYSQTSASVMSEEQLKSSKQSGRKSEKTISDGAKKTENTLELIEEKNSLSLTPASVSSMLPTHLSESITEETLENGRGKTQTSDSRSDSSLTESLQRSTESCSLSRVDCAPSAEHPEPLFSSQNDSQSAEKCTLTIVTHPEKSEVCFAPDVISESESSTTHQRDSSRPQCTCGNTPLKAIVSKPVIFGWGVNLQNCSHTAFVGLSHSFEALYQAVRRHWRFGQRNEVYAHIITSSAEIEVLSNIKRKRDDFDRMVRGMVEHMAAVSRAEIKASTRTSVDYNPTVEMTVPKWLGVES